MSRMRSLYVESGPRRGSSSAVTSALVNYHVARWNLLKNLGVMSVEGERFWLKKQGLSGDTSTNNPKETGNLPEVVTPRQIFGEPDAQMLRTEDPTVPMFLRWKDRSPTPGREDC